MNKTGIEWVRNPDGSQGYTWNPITGCLNHVNGLCKGGGFPCYAYKLAHGRLKQRYLANDNWPRLILNEGIKWPIGYHPSKDPFYPRFWEERLKDMAINHRSNASQKAKGYFVCDMGDLFGIGVPEEWTRRVLSSIGDSYYYHRFYLLTKQPQRLPEFSPFPDNCWVGVTATNTEMFLRACTFLEYPLRAKLAYISMEPLLEWSFNWEQSYLVNALKRADMGWLIIGACTGTKKDMEELCKRYPNLTLTHWKGNIWTAQPRIEDLREIVEAADKAGVKVFLKDNLRTLLIPEDCSKPNYLTEDIFWASEKAQLRQELPNG